MVIFTSDNGGQLNVGADNTPFRDGKQSMYEGGLRVAFGAKWPGRIKAGSRSGHIALTMDIFPTILKAAGAPALDGIDGLSFPFLTGGPGELAGILLNALGGDLIDLVTYDVPRLEFSAGISRNINIFGPIVATFGGEFGAQGFGSVSDGGTKWYPGDADAGMIVFEPTPW